MKKLFLVLSIASMLTLQACGKKEEAGCSQFASKFSCDYVLYQATYKVFYWKDVLEKNDPNDERYVGTAVGLSNCRQTAIYAHQYEMEYRKNNWKNWNQDNWSERSYICMLTKDGRNLEKHRY